MCFGISYERVDKHCVLTCSVLVGFGLFCWSIFTHSVSYVAFLVLSSIGWLLLADWLLVWFLAFYWLVHFLR